MGQPYSLQNVKTESFKIRRLIIFLVLIWSPLSHRIASAETIRLKSGQTITAPILEYAPDRIKVDVKGIAITYYKDEIESIAIEPAQQRISRSLNVTPPADIISKILPEISKSVVVIEARKENSLMQGTGFFISSDGLVATNLHVVFKARSILIKKKDGMSYPVLSIVNFNEDLDLCVLKIDLLDAPALRWGDSDLLKTGDILFTVGHREGSLYETSSGTFMGKKMLDGEESLQSKMVTGHGNSGGPILDQEGDLVGISKAFDPATGQNFGIPINAAKPYLGYNTLVTVDEFNKLISPAHELTYSGQGSFMAGQFGAASLLFKQALALDPNFLKAKIALAKTYRSMFMENEEFNTWLEVNKQDPENILSYVRLGKISLNRNNFDEGIGYLQKAVDLNSQTPDVYGDLGYAYGKQNRLKESIAAYKKAVDLNPQDADSHYNLAVAYFNKHDFLSAQKYSDKARTLGYAVPESFLSQLQQSFKFGNMFESK